MSQGIGYRFARVSAVSGVSTVLSIGLQLVSVPVCLRFWGSDTYGRWLAINAAFMLLRTMDGGYINYVGNKLNILFHSDEQALRSTMASAVWGVAILGALQLGALIVLYLTDTMGMVLGAKTGAVGSLQPFLALAVLCISWIFTGSYLGIIHRFLIPTGMMYQAAWWTMALQLAQFCALIAAAVCGLNLLQTAVLFAACQAGIYLASAYYIKMKLPAFYPWWRRPDRSVGIRDLLRSVPFTASGALQQAGVSGMVVAVSSIIGPVAVPAFATVRTLSNLWTTLIATFTAPLLPEVVRFHARSEADKLASVQRAHWVLIAVVVDLSIMLAYPFLGTAYGIWTGHRLPLDRSLLCLLLAALPLAGMSALVGVYLTGINRFDYVFVCATLRGAVALVLGIVLMPSHGLAGLGMSVFVAEVAVLAYSLRQFFARREHVLRTAGRALAGWHWLPTVATVGFLLLESANMASSGLVYGVCLGLALMGSGLAWSRLDAGVRNRAYELLSLLSRTK